MLNPTVVKGVVLESPFVTAAYRAGSVARADAYAVVGRRWDAVSARFRALRAAHKRRLHSLDEVAYVRFASVYRSFRDISEFMQELKDLLSDRTRELKPPGPTGGKDG